VTDLSRYADWMAWLTAQAEADADVRCVWVGGSAATGGWDDWSDLDSDVLCTPGLRLRVLEEAIVSDLPGLVLTVVWGLELEGDRDAMQQYADLVTSAGGRVAFVELAAPLAVREARNNTEFRLAEKKSKRDRAFNDANLLDLEQHVLNTRPGVRTLAEDLLDQHPHLRIDNSDLPAAEAARQVAAWLAAQRQRG
jgi:predicted nucleotidyltransferase